MGKYFKNLRKILFHDILLYFVLLHLRTKFIWLNSRNTLDLSTAEASFIIKTSFLQQVLWPIFMSQYMSTKYCFKKHTFLPSTKKFKWSTHRKQINNFVFFSMYWHI